MVTYLYLLISGPVWGVGDGTWPAAADAAMKVEARVLLDVVEQYVLLLKLVRHRRSHMEYNMQHSRERAPPGSRK
jgi:hypothetical protein